MHVPNSSSPLPRRHWLRNTMGLSAAIALTGCATRATISDATPSSGTAAWQPWVMPGVQTLDLPVPALPGQTGQRQQKLMVYVPAGAAPAGGFPVIYALDGNLTFGLLAQSVHNRGSRGADMRGPSAIVVGLGQGGLPDGEVHDRPARTFDYTPPYPDVQPDSQGRAQGGADLFLDFVAQQVQPLIAQHFPANMQQQTLMGHSFGGLCCLYALFTRPDMFQQYVAASPSLWWGEGLILHKAQDFVQRHQRAAASAHPLRLHLSRGSEEGKPRADNRPTNPDRAASALKAQQLGSISDLPQRLASVPGLATSYSIWPDADHGGSLYFACMQAARLGVQWGTA